MPVVLFSGSQNTLRIVIILAATPIGNLADASLRLRQSFENATVIAAEDTRNTLQLMRLLEIDNRPELISLGDHNEHHRAAGLVERAKNEDILVVSDAGMPTVSDPGFKLVQLAAQEGVTVTIVPGPSAVTSALAVAGLPTDRFAFEGFVPRKASDRARLIEMLKTEPRTTVFFEAPTRIAQTLADLAGGLEQGRQAAVCRELTKLHEEVRRGSLQQLAEWAQGGVRGEIVLVIGPAELMVADVSSVLPELLARVESGQRLKDAAKSLAAERGVSARDLYEAALAARED